MRENPHRRSGAVAGRPWRRQALVVAVVALVATALTVGPPAGAAPGGQDRPKGTGKPDTGKLTARLAGLSRAAGGGDAPTADTSVGARLASLPDNQRGGVRRLEPGTVVVDVRVDAVTGAVQRRLAGAGANVLAVSDPTFRTVTVSIPDAGLERLAEVDGVQNVKEVITPMRRACTPLISEGDVQLKANQARAMYGSNGSGVTVGILSDSFDKFPPGAVTNATADVAAGELPGAANGCGYLTPVTKLDDTAPAPYIDEGRAMAQTVHDLAPGAGISFATAFISETSFAQNITALANSGARVLVDDIGYFNEPFYQDGPISIAVNNARAAGVAFFSAAGNDNTIVGGKDVGSYEAMNYRATACPGAFTGYLDCHGFNPAGGDPTASMSLPNNRTLVLDLQWAQPRGGVTTDYDICIVDSGTGNPLGCGVDVNAGATGTQEPFELAGYTNSTGVARSVSEVVARYEGAPARFKWIHVGDDPSSVEYSTSTGGDVFGPTIYGHSGTEGVYSVGAVHFSSPSALETYSGRGPMTNLFAPVPSVSPLPAPQVLAKPDFVATDCVQNSFFPPGSGSPYRFCGTSVAAPHAAAVAALMFSANPALSATQIGSALKATAVPVGAQPPSAVGAGLIDAKEAVGLVAVDPGTLAARYNPVTPARILDTRFGTGAPQAKVGPAGTINVQVTGQGGVPANGVTAVVLNVTALDLTAPSSFLTAWPTGQARPLASNLNYVTGQIVPNLVVVKVGAGGQVSLYNHAGSVDMAADVAGWYGDDVATTGSRYTALTPARILDTRFGTGAPLAKVGPASTTDVQITGQGGVPASGVTAVVLNVTALGLTAPASFLTAWPSLQSRPVASNLNYVAGQIVPNLVVVKVGTNGRVSLYNHAGTVDLAADVAGYFGADAAPTGARYNAVTPARTLDTRFGQGAPLAKVGTQSFINLRITGLGGVPLSGVSAVVLNVTALGLTEPASFLTVWPTGESRPLASNLNYLAGQIVPNLVVVKVGAGGMVSLYNHAGSVDVAADVAGWYNSE